MANEFKVRKGLIVEGSGSVVLDIQGSQGQLFSITDDLTGDIFSVSDISGVPILNVNADGTTTIDGTLTLTNDEVLDSTSDTSIKFLTRDSNGVVKYHSLGSNAFNSTAFTTNTGTTTADNSQTFTNKGGNISQWTNDSGFTTNTGTTTADNSQTFTNKGGNISQWTNDSGYITSFTNTVDMGSGFVIEDGDGTEVTITENKEVKFVEGTGIDINWTDTSNGSDGDPYDLTITNTAPAGASHLNSNTTKAQVGLGNVENTALSTYTGNGGALDNQYITNGASYTTNTGTLTGNGTSTYIPFYNGTTTFGNTNKLTWNGASLSTHGLTLTGTLGQSSEATSLMINSSGIVGTRELGSNAFNSTAFTTNTGTLTGNGTSGRIPIYNGTTSFTTDSGFGYAANKLSIDGTLRSNGVDIISNATTAANIIIGDVTEADTVVGIQFKVYADTMIDINDDNVSIKAPKLTDLSAQNSEATALMINGSSIVGTRELGSNAFNSTAFTTNTGTLTGNGSTNRVPFYSGTTTLTTDNTFTYAAASDALSVGKVSLAVGSATSPSVYFAGQSNTGLYWTYSPESMYVTVNGSTKAQWDSNGYKVVAGALGVNVTPSTTDGRIDAGNDIVAYSSDKRLKENIKPIKNALDKVQSLSGFTYNWNEKAEEVAGFDRDESLVGVFAQDVQSILPEAVKPAPFDNDGENNSISGENYLTVQYDKLTPLLIESIKELKAEIEELKKCKCKCNKGEI